MARTKLYPPSVDPGFPVLPETPAGWKRLKFSDALEVIERSIKLDPDKTYKLVNAKRNRGGITLRNESQGKEVLTKSQFIAKAGDFLISRRQIIHGACGIVPDELDNAVVSNEYSTLRTRSPLLMEYLNHYCHTPYFQRTCFHSSHGVDVEKMIFKIEQWLNRELDLPPLPEQRKIAAILSAVDVVIERTQAVIDQLQQVKKALMQQLLTRGIPGRHTRFKQTEIGEVPEGWDVTQFGSLMADGPTNGIYKPAELLGSGVMLVGMTAIDTDNEVVPIAWSNSRRAIVESHELERHRLAADDLLFRRVYARIDGVGRAICVPHPPEDSIYESNMMRVRLYPRMAIPLFFRYFFDSLTARTQIEESASLAAQASINNQNLRRIIVPVPKINEQVEICRYLYAISSRIEAERMCVKWALGAKSALMSVLLSGEVRVKVEEGAA